MELIKCYLQRHARAANEPFDRQYVNSLATDTETTFRNAKIAALAQM